MRLILEVKLGDDPLYQSKAMRMKLLSQVLAKIHRLSGKLHFKFTSLYKYEAVKLNTLEGDDTLPKQKIINNNAKIILWPAHHLLPHFYRYCNIYIHI